jgi:hypothetical protein
MNAAVSKNSLRQSVPAQGSRHECCTIFVQTPARRLREMRLPANPQSKIFVQS